MAAAILNGIVVLKNGVTSAWSAVEYYPERVSGQFDRIDAGESIGTRPVASGPYIGAFRYEYNIGMAADECIARRKINSSAPSVRERVGVNAGRKLLIGGG